MKLQLELALRAAILARSAAPTSDLEQDFGYAGTGSIGDTIWLDLDGDGTPDASDVCPAKFDDQTDSDGDGTGDACQCGDVDLSGVVEADARDALADAEAMARDVPSLAAVAPISSRSTTAISANENWATTVTGTTVPPQNRDSMTIGYAGINE